MTFYAFTTDETDAPLFRLVIAPSEGNGLRSISRLMVDKITTVPKSEVGIPKRKSPGKGLLWMADGVRFELTVDLRLRQFSRLEP